MALSSPAFTLPDETHIGIVRLQVTDLEQALAYYQRVLGLRIHSRTADAATLGPHDDDRSLLELRTRSGVTRARRGALGLYHFAILLPDRTSLGRFAAHVAALNLRVGMADHFVSEALYLWDPDGLGIEVYADRPRSAWQHRNGELVMTTDPLDIAGVIAAGGNRPWEGMPPGTTIGHVHLHVGNLAEAEAFYRAALGFAKTVWSYPGALFLSAGGYHHHLGTNTWSSEPAAKDDEARLIDWELVVPRRDHIASAAGRLRSAGYLVAEAGGGYAARDPWGTVVRVVTTS